MRNVESLRVTGFAGDWYIERASADDYRICRYHKAGRQISRRFKTLDDARAAWRDKHDRIPVRARLSPSEAKS